MIYFNLHFTPFFSQPSSFIQRKCLPPISLLLYSIRTFRTNHQFKPGNYGNNLRSILKERRLALDLSLREFARRVAMQPSNYCNVEADVLQPPPAESLDRLAKALGLKKGVPDSEMFHGASPTGAVMKLS